MAAQGSVQLPALQICPAGQSAALAHRPPPSPPVAPASTLPVAPLQPASANNAAANHPLVRASIERRSFRAPAGLVPSLRR